MKRACLLLLPAMLLIVLAAPGCNDDESKPVFTRVMVAPMCGVIPLQIETFAAVSGGNESGDPMGGTNNLEIAWKFGDGGTGTTAINYHRYETAGEYNVIVTARDPDGNTTTASVPVTVLADSMTITAGSSFPDGDPGTGERIQFSSTSEACDIDYPAVLGDSVKMVFRWEVADVDSTHVFRGAEPSYTFETAGDFDVDLTITYPALAITRQDRLHFTVTTP